MVPSASMRRQTGPVHPSEPHERPRRPFGPLRSLAAALESSPEAGAGSPRTLERLLAGLAAELGATELAWLQRRGGEIVASRPLTLRSVDWEFVRDLEPDSVRRLSGDCRRRAPRLAVRSGGELYVAAEEGVLRCLGSAARELGDADARALVELVAGVARRDAERTRSKEAHGERALGRRAASLGHDMRNQMTLALMELERLRDTDREALEAQGFDGLKSVLEEARELCVDTLSRGKRSTPQALGLRAILTREAQAAADVARRSTGVRVFVSCPAGLVIHGSASVLARLVRNLLSNAIEASFDGGEVRVKARAIDAGRIELAVTDRGRGMAQSQVEELFASGTSASGGTGFGTTSLFECLRDLHGELAVDTELGGGTCFTVRLSGAPLGDVEVLIVDADARRRSVTACRCAGSSRSAGVATPGEALDHLRGGKVRRVLVARGTLESGELRAYCEREGLVYEVTSARPEPVLSAAPRLHQPA